MKHAKLYSFRPTLEGTFDIALGSQLNGGPQFLRPQYPVVREILTKHAAQCKQSGGIIISLYISPKGLNKNEADSPAKQIGR